MGLKSFEKSIEESIEENVDFVLCSGDLFDTSRPPIDILERTVESLKKLNNSGIQFYAIEGSHDFSPTDKTMLRVLDSAGLLKRVAKISSSDEHGLRLKFTTDEKTGAKITGIVGRQRTVEESYYNDLDRKWLQDEKGFKIFMFHSAISEFRPEIFQHMESIPLSLLPKGFDYYAGGHVHKTDVFEEGDYGIIAYPGFTFPNDFRELELFEHGHYFLAESNGELEVKRKDLKLAEVVSVKIDADGTKPDELEEKIENKILEKQIENKIVLYRVEGTLKSGQISDINFNSLSKKLREDGARIVRRNTSKLSTKEYEEVKVESSSRSEIEKRLIEEQVGNYSLPDVPEDEREKLTKELMDALDSEKTEGETNTDYKKRIIDAAVKSMKLEDIMGESE